MNMSPENLLIADGWFSKPGAYVLVDGQYGSTGKGLIAGVIGEVAARMGVETVTTNAGPNSGHTAYIDGDKVVTQQLPIASVVMRRRGLPHTCYLNGGALIDPKILQSEMEQHKLEEYVNIHPHAALILDKDCGSLPSLDAIASTGKGTGPATARKALREPDAVVAHYPGLMNNIKIDKGSHPCDVSSSRVFVETAQGFSLGINSGFYPYCTSRECTVGQALVDARIHPDHLRKTMMTVRTFPIRVGNADGYSGDCYPDQTETTWGAIGQVPEITTVTKRVRRVFTWSRQQFRDAVAVNRPDAIFLNFCNYLSSRGVAELVGNIREDYFFIMGRRIETLLLGYGPQPDDILVMLGDRKEL